ncbi:hypothetical protein PILCRDRAFT_16990 [Piloderma croceum F 1598]|uniref:Uncharacterized protein n=1 Tax=Piloderma croceum (strain F 1598) TaxID=765440 RepID=A0A0C3B2P8_PILCF|nr:hypothetical protein PILCRDRAFT_16990 [Piloderma croceum F 1598]
MDPGYNHNDEPKESEADWLRVFSAWEGGVCELYPHRSDELAAYRHFANDLFQANPSEADIVIHFDQHVRLRYNKNPFQIDDLTLTQVSFYASLAKPVTKRDQPTDQPLLPSSGTKCAKMICMNWNQGLQQSDLQSHFGLPYNKGH